MTPFFLKWHWDLGTGCSSLEKSPPIQNLMALLQQPPLPPVQRHRLVRPAKHPDSPTKWYSKDTQGHGWSCSHLGSKLRTRRLPRPRLSLWDAEWEGQPELSSTLPTFYVFSSHKAHWNPKFLSLRYRLKRMENKASSFIGVRENSMSWAAVSATKLVIYLW